MGSNGTEPVVLPEAHSEPLPAPRNEKRGTITCNHCGAEFSAPMPDIGIINTPAVSLAVAPHERFDACPRCGTRFVPALVQIAGQWCWQPAPPQFQATRILTAHGSKLQ